MDAPKKVCPNQVQDVPKAPNWVSKQLGPLKLPERERIISTEFDLSKLELHNPMKCGRH